MSMPGGMIDLSTLKKPEQQASAPSGARSSYEVQLSEQTVQDVVTSSAQVPVLVVVYSPRVPDVDAFLRDVGTVVDEAGGRLQVAFVDGEAEQRLAAALQVQQVPTTFLIVAGQIQPLFPGVASADELRPLMAQVLAAAEQAGANGTAEPSAQPAEGEEQTPDEPLSPLHQKARAAIDAGDYAAAEAAYRDALVEQPADEEAAIGLSTVQLLARTHDADATAVRTAAASDPSDRAAQLAVADLDMLGGHVDDAFSRLLDLVRSAADEDQRSAARERLVSFFAMVGTQDPRVVKARRRLANSLY